MEIRTSRIIKVLLYVIGVMVLFWPWVDYFDLGLWKGVNVFHLDRDLAAVVSWFVGIPTLGTLLLSVRVFREQQRQRELNTRPYLRLAWDSRLIGDNRRLEGITDSCFIAVNEGKGHMRNVVYHGKIGDQEVVLRRHEFIRAGSQTNIVYDDTLNKSGPAFGDRNNVNTYLENTRIIKEEKVDVWGSYQDLTSKATYRFRFISDIKSQSGLSEPYSQDRIS